jgi:hypothetical protein
MSDKWRDKETGNWKQVEGKEVSPVPPRMLPILLQIRKVLKEQQKRDIAKVQEVRENINRFKYGGGNSG